MTDLGNHFARPAHPLARRGLLVLALFGFALAAPLGAFGHDHPDGRPGGSGSDSECRICDAGAGGTAVLPEAAASAGDRRDGRVPIFGTEIPRPTFVPAAPSRAPPA